MPKIGNYSCDEKSNTHKYESNSSHHQRFKNQIEFQIYEEIYSHERREKVENIEELS